VTEDVGDRFHFNTAIAAIMELVNALGSFEQKRDPANIPVIREVLETLILMLAPFVPHFAEELWESTGHQGGVETAGWPKYDAAAAVDEELLVVLQVNGKLRGKVTVPVDANQESVERMALADPKIQGHLEGKTVRKVIYVPGRLLNIVAG
jgi:leucyl-tRNA synthetase